MELTNIEIDELVAHTSGLHCSDNFVLKEEAIDEGSDYNLYALGQIISGKTFSKHMVCKVMSMS